MEKISQILPPKSHRNECTQAYTFDYVYAVVMKLREAKKSFRYIAKEIFRDRITFGTVQRISQGNEPHDPKIRAAIGLPVPNAVVVIIGGGSIPPGCQVISASMCECGQPFISNHPARKKCFICSPYRKRK